MTHRIDGLALRALLEDRVGTSSASELARRFGKNRVTYQRWFSTGISTELGWKKLKEIVCVNSDEELESLLSALGRQCNMGRFAETICRSLETIRDREEFHGISERVLLWQGIRVLLTIAPDFSARELNAVIDAFHYAEQLGVSNGIPLPNFKETQSLLIRRILNLRKTDVNAFKKCYPSFCGQKLSVKNAGLTRKMSLR